MMEVKPFKYVDKHLHRNVPTSEPLQSGSLGAAFQGVTVADWSDPASSFVSYIVDETCSSIGVYNYRSV